MAVLDPGASAVLVISITAASNSACTVQMSYKTGATHQPRVSALLRIDLVEMKLGRVVDDGVQRGGTGDTRLTFPARLPWPRTRWYRRSGCRAGLG